MRRLYRALLYLYPTSFRVDYGDEMLAAFDAQRAGAGPLAAAALLVRSVADAVRSALALHWELLVRDLRYTARTLGRARGFAVTAILVTAIGVGANTAAFSVADFVLLRPLPFDEPDGLVKLWQRTPGYTRMELSPANYRDWEAMNSSFELMGAYNRAFEVNLVGAGGEPERLASAAVMPEVFEVLGARPLFGRLFRSREDGDLDPRTLVLSYGLWQSRFGGDPEILGHSVRVNGEPFEVIGVMPPAFHFPDRDTRLWRPLDLPEDAFVDRNDNFLEAVGRLADGVTLEAARADLDLVAARLAQDYPELGETGANLVRLREAMSAQSRTLLLALGGASLCMLLLACANLANLLLGRAASRERELAVRAALGAGRERLVRQMVTEGVTLAVLGGAAGLVLGVLAVPLLGRLVPAEMPLGAQPGLDLRVLAIAGLLTACIGLAVGVIPAFRTGGRRGFGALRAGLRSGGGRRQRLRAVLVAAEIAVSVVLMISSGLLIRAAHRVQTVDPGFDTDGVLTLRTGLPRPKYDDPVRRAEFYDRVLTDVRALPGVRSAAYVSGLPMVMTGGIWPVVFPGGDSTRSADNTASLRFVTPGYLETLGIPILLGRDVDERDDGEQPFVAVVSESFVKRYWPGENPLGRSFEFGLQERTVVGVAGDIRVRGLERASEPQVYLPHRQVPVGGLWGYDPKDLAIRFAGASAASLLPSIRAVIRAADPDQPISAVRMLSDVVAGETVARRAQLRVLGALAAVALILAAVGIHGVLAVSVHQRSHEIAVRLALGAAPGAVARMITWEGARFAALGVVVGVAAAYAVARTMSALLFGVEPGDPAVMAGAATVGVLMALAGSLFPARRAMRLSPMAVMKAD